MRKVAAILVLLPCKLHGLDGTNNKKWAPDLAPI